MSNKRMGLLMLACLGLAIVSSASATVYYSEDFESYSSGTALTSIGWWGTNGAGGQTGMSDLLVTNQTGFGGMAIDASTAPTGSTADYVFQHNHSMDSTLSTDEVIKFQFQMSTASGGHNSGMKIYGGPSSQGIAVWANTSGGLYFDPRAITGGTEYEFFNEGALLSGNFDVTIYIDNVNLKTWATAFDGTNTYTTTEFAYGAGHAGGMTTVQVYNDRRYGWTGADVDNILVETVPEPATMALLGLGGAALALRRKRS